MCLEADIKSVRLIPVNKHTIDLKPVAMFFSCMLVLCPGQIWKSKTSHSVQTRSFFCSIQYGKYCWYMYWLLNRTISYAHKRLTIGIKLLKKYPYWHTGIMKYNFHRPVSCTEFRKAVTAYENHKQYCLLKIVLLPSVMWLVSVKKRHFYLNYQHLRVSATSRNTHNNHNMNPKWLHFVDQYSTHIKTLQSTEMAVTRMI